MGHTGGHLGLLANSRFRETLSQNKCLAGCLTSSLCLQNHLWTCVLQTCAQYIYIHRHSIHILHTHSCTPYSHRDMSGNSHGHVYSNHVPNAHTYTDIMYRYYIHTHVHHIFTETHVITHIYTTHTHHTYIPHTHTHTTYTYT